MDQFMALPRDGLPDDRVTCASCRHCRTQGSWCKRFTRTTETALPRRCYGYIPLKSERDQAAGVKRWPGLMRNIVEAGALDREFAKRRNK